MILLGSTGSIGVNSLAIAQRFDLPIDVLAAGSRVELLNEQIRAFQPSIVVVGKRELVPLVDHDMVLYGEEGMIEALHRSTSETVINALVGFAGLKPTIEAIKLGKKVALANKESLVVGGQFIDTAHITPIDSEHFALWYLLQDSKKVEKMTITASGGSFRNTPIEKIADMTPAQALKHPNWTMGKKITIDSATMTNKLFELLEAKWLFACEKLDAIIETKSIIHAIIDFKDGSSTAHLASADMKLPIAYALMHQVDEPILKPINLVEVGSLEFREIETARYPIWEIKEDILQHPHLGVVINAANEIGIEKFFQKEINFAKISDMSIKAYEKFSNIAPKVIEDIFEIDKEVRNFCKWL